MTYRLFYTDQDFSEANYRDNKPRLTPITYRDRDDALGMARDIRARGGVAWEIVNDEGDAIDRREIARLLLERGAELVGRPKIR